MITLRNGIKLIFLTNNKKYINVDFAFKVGNKDEDENQRGYAHLLEHLFLRSTKNKKYIDVINELEENGSQINACTKQEFTHFFVDCLVNKFKSTFDLFLELIQNNYFDEQEYRRTLKIINEEIELYRKSPLDSLKDLLIKSVYDCRMQNCITDRKFENIPNFDNVILYKYNHYVNEKLIVIISGKISRTIKRYVIERLQSIQLKSHVNNENTLLIKEANEFPIVIKKCDSRIILGKRYIHKTNNFIDFLKLKILGKVLGGSLSSRLFKYLREERGLVYSIYSYTDMFYNHASLTIISYVSSANLAELYRLLEKNLSNNTLLSITQEEFEKSKTLLCLNFAKEFSNNNTLSQFISECYHIYSECINYKKLLKSIKNIKYDDFIKFCGSLNDKWYNSILEY